MTSLDFLRDLNVALAIIGALVAFGAIERMDKKTDLAIAVSFVTVMVGLVGQALSTILNDHWQQIFDTLLLGGVTGMLVATRRATIVMPPPWMPKISIVISATTWAAFFMLMER